MSQKFPKNEKLKSRKMIARLFSEGKSYKKFPVKVFFIEVEDAETNQATFAVPKRNFKLAVSRNHIKRKLREAYRINKGAYLEKSGKKFALLFLYLGREKPTYEAVEASVISFLKKLTDESN